MQAQRRLVQWDPSGSPRFVVAGGGVTTNGDVRMYEWLEEQGEIKTVGLQVDLGVVRSIAWSPHPSYPCLLAAGLGNGKTHLISLSPSTLSQPSSHTTPESTLPQSTIAILPVKQNRAVTSLSFSPIDPNYLACGLDKTRSEYSLLIWDLADAISRAPDANGKPFTRPLDRLEVRTGATPLSGIASGSVTPTAADTGSQPRHIQHYCPSETVNSVSFLQTDLYHLLASSSNKIIRMFDLRSPANINAAAQSAGAASWATRAVWGLAPDPTNENRFASYEDGGQGIVRIWDRRRPGAELLGFEAGGGGVCKISWESGWDSRGRLGVATREGGVSVWDVINGQSPKTRNEEWSILAAMRTTPKTDQPLQSFTFAYGSSAARQTNVLVLSRDGTMGIGALGESPSFTSSSQGDVAIFPPHSLDPQIVPPASLADLNQPTRRGPSRTPPPAANDPGDVSSTEDEDEDDDASAANHEIPRQNRFQLAPNRVSRLRIEHQTLSRSQSPSTIRNLPFATSDVKTNGDGLHDTRQVASNDEAYEKELKEWRRLTGVDIGVVMRRRVEAGYGLDDLRTNAATGTRLPRFETLRGIWEWLAHFTDLMGPGKSRHDNYDFTYQGVCGIWFGIPSIQDLEQSSRNPPRNGTHKTHSSLEPSQPLPANDLLAQTSPAWTAALRNQNMSGTRPHAPSRGGTSPASRHSDLNYNDPECSSAIAALNNRHGGTLSNMDNGEVRFPPTSKGPQRRRILAICGESFGEGLAAEVKRLERDGQRTKAACWACFGGDTEKAIQILIHSPNEHHRLMAATIAGFHAQSQSDNVSSFWHDHWQKLVMNLDDSYLRAMLTKIASRDWGEVMSDEAIPLMDRISIAVRFRSDDELSTWLKEREKRCHYHGSLHGLVLTGFTSSGLSLIQSWLDRSSDLQTAALLATYFIPGRLTAPERAQLDRWQQGYRDLLDSWKRFHDRCLFDMNRGKIRRMLGNEGMADKVAPMQVLVVCPVCHNLITKQTHEQLMRKSAIRKTASHTVRTSSCLYCGTVLPRCVICLLHVTHAPAAEIADDATSPGDTVDQAYVYCQTCRHGGHSGHILQWFHGSGPDGEPPHEICAVADCTCKCASI